MSILFFSTIKNRLPALMLAALAACAAGVTHAQSTRTVAPSSTPAAPAPKATVVTQNPTAKAKVAKPKPSPTITTPRSAPPVVQAQLTQPLQVITIVHRLSGWKLKTWLKFTNATVLNQTFSNQFVYTNIVAGYVLGDGRSVVARLPEAEAELLTIPSEFANAASKSVQEASALTLVRRDGASFGARFIGLDGSTWLSLVQANGLRLPPSRDASEESLAVGLRVRMFAPLRAQRAGAGGTAVYLRVGEIKGTVTEVTRASTGRVTRLTVSGEGLSPQIVGGVVLNEAGETVGLIEKSTAGEARVMPALIVKRAAERLLKRRSSVPRPLLGVRGEAISSSTLKQLEESGWKIEEATKVLNEQMGVLLTKVTPNSPAALADLRAGDIITRVNNGEIKSSEDFSYLLNEAGGGANVSITVLRAESAPREVTVKLSEALNLRRATEYGFAVAQGTSSSSVSGTTTPTPTAPVTVAPQAPVGIGTGKPPTPPTKRTPAPTTRPTILADVDWIILPAEKGKPRTGTRTALLVNSVRPGSLADKLGLRAGDLILSVNGQKLAQGEWTEKFLQRKATELSLEVLRGRERLTLKSVNK